MKVGEACFGRVFFNFQFRSVTLLKIQQVYRNRATFNCTKKKGDGNEKKLSLEK